jgi:hypothetical protein
LRLGEVSLERVELLLPKLSAVLDPFDGIVHRPRPQPAAVNAPFLLAVKQARALEHAQVPRDRRRGHLKRSGQIADRSLTVREALEDAPANRIGQRGEDGVEGAGSILNHRVKY